MNRKILCLVLGLVWLEGASHAASIVGSSHDLSAGSSSSGPKAVSETQICVFCHTPHMPTPTIPLWNHLQTTQSFTFYSSNYLNAYLGFPTPAMAQFPGTHTKLCLSCHDGLTALGGVYNLGGGPGTIPMTGRLRAETVLGTSLADDHPVLYSVKPGAGPPLQPGTDPEIRLPPVGDKVKVYGPNNMVECTSCHNPHDNQYGKFLAKSNANADLCTTCHLKTGFSASAHRTSTIPYTPPGERSTTVGEWSCRNCHRSHGASPAQAYLLREGEEDTCYLCHGNPSLPGAKNIKLEYAQAAKHPTETVRGKHQDPELDGSNFTYTPTNNRHAECQDCHHPHQAKPGVHTPPTAQIANVLLGQWGVNPVYGSAPWTLPSSYTRVTFEDTTNYKEHQLCLKCHSSYGFGTTPPPGITDQALEFNVNNKSYHWVGVGNSRSTALATVWASSYLSPWRYDSPMACTDCHASGNDADPRGPHGSANPRLLRGLWTNLTGSEGNVTGHLCFKCHDKDVYSFEGTRDRSDDVIYSGFRSYNNGNLHFFHLKQVPWIRPGLQVSCMTCHSKVPHGGPHIGTEDDTHQRGKLIVYQSDPAPYTDGTTAKILRWYRGFRDDDLVTPRYAKQYCGTARGCHREDD